MQHLWKVSTNSLCLRPRANGTSIRCILVGRRKTLKQKLSWSFAESSELIHLWGPQPLLVLFKENPKYR